MADIHLRMLSSAHEMMRAQHEPLLVAEVGIPRFPSHPGPLEGFFLRLPRLSGFVGWSQRRCCGCEPGIAEKPSRARLQLNGQQPALLGKNSWRDRFGLFHPE